MNARTTFPQLPLGDGAASTPPLSERPVVEGEASSSAAVGQQETPSSSAAVGQQKHHPDYLRLFGMIPPEQVITPLASLSPEARGTYGSPPSSSEAVGQTRTSALCDPTQAASHPLYQLLEVIGHPSALSLAGIAALRARHMANGHTPQADAAQGPLFFKHKADEAYRAALSARFFDTRRKRLITAVAILVAQIDAEDFAAQQHPQQEPTP